MSTEEAEILNPASDQGRIRLALRNNNDIKLVYSKGVTTSNLFGHHETSPTPKVQPLNSMAAAWKWSRG